MELKWNDLSEDDSLSISESFPLLISFNNYTAITSEFLSNYGTLSLLMFCLPQIRHPYF